MKFTLQILFFCIFSILVSCQSKETSYNDTIEVLEQFSDLQSIIDSDKNTLWVINFWATSCPPCLKEMPHFKELEKEFQDKNLKILLISLDQVKHLESRVYPFVKKYEIVPEVALLEDQNYSAWTVKIDSTWYGALPATVIIKGENRKFRFGIYQSYKELLDDVNEINKN